MATPCVKTLTALRFVKDELLEVGGETKFSFTKELLADIKASYTRYKADRVTKRWPKKLNYKERVRSC